MKFGSSATDDEGVSKSITKKPPSLIVSELAPKIHMTTMDRVCGHFLIPIFCVKE